MARQYAKDRGSDVTDSKRSVRLEAASFAWLDPRGEPRLTIVASGLWRLGTGAIGYVGAVPISAAELHEAARSLDPRVRLDSDEPSARPTLDPSGRLVVYQAHGGTQTTRSIDVPFVLQA